MLALPGLPALKEPPTCSAQNSFPQQRGRLSSEGVTRHCLVTHGKQA